MKKVYIEAGANNGIIQSRSYKYEYNSKYFGILIEPDLYSYQQCLKNRNNCKVFNCALVSFDHKESTIKLYKHNKSSLMHSCVKSYREDYFKYTNVPARTLDSILDELNIYAVEFLFLDAEGYELEILKGINFHNKYIKNIEIELHHQLKNKHIDDEINIFRDYLAQYKYYIKKFQLSESQPKILLQQ